MAYALMGAGQNKSAAVFPQYESNVARSILLLSFIQTLKNLKLHSILSTSNFLYDFEALSNLLCMVNQECSCDFSFANFYRCHSDCQP